MSIPSAVIMAFTSAPSSGTDVRMTDRIVRDIPTLRSPIFPMRDAARKGIARAGARGLRIRVRERQARAEIQFDGNFVGRLIPKIREFDHTDDIVFRRDFARFFGIFGSEP